MYLSFSKFIRITFEILVSCKRLLGSPLHKSDDSGLLRILADNKILLSLQE